MLEVNRRTYLRRQGRRGGGGLAWSANPFVAEAQSEPAPQVAAKNNHQIALIGAGRQGQFMRNRAEVPGVKLVAVADCSTAVSSTARNSGATICLPLAITARFWNAKASMPSSSAPRRFARAGRDRRDENRKDVYCQKPMIDLYSNGKQMIEAATPTSRASKWEASG